MSLWVIGSFCLQWRNGHGFCLTRLIAFQLMGHINLPQKLLGCEFPILVLHPRQARILAPFSVLVMRMLELALYFQQDNQRIARCDYCWGWFVPKTKKATRYCDRVTDGFISG